MVVVINIAEKPSVARAMAEHLGRGTHVNLRRIGSCYVNEFNYSINNIGTIMPG